MSAPSGGQALTYIGLILNALCSLARDSEPLFTYGLTRSLNERKLEEGYEARRRWRAQGTRSSHAGGRVRADAGSWDSRLTIDIGRKFAALNPAAVRMPRCVSPSLHPPSRMYSSDVFVCFYHAGYTKASSLTEASSRKLGSKLRRVQASYIGCDGDIKRDREATKHFLVTVAS